MCVFMSVCLRVGVFICVFVCVSPRDRWIMSVKFCTRDPEVKKSHRGHL